MKTYYSLLSLIFFVGLNTLFSQSNDSSLTINLDLLKAPQSPAATLLGIADSEISRPSDPTAFMVSIRQATNNFTEVPLKYAVDFSPAWVFFSNDIKAKNFLSSKPGHSIPQSLIISAAIDNSDITDSLGTFKNTAVGFGMKFSIFRGSFSTKTQEQIDTSLQLAQKRNQELSVLIEEEKTKSAEWQRIIKAIPVAAAASDEKELQILQLQGEVELAKLTKLAEAKLQDYEAEFKKITDKLDFTRKGFKLDFNAAVAFDFPEQIYDNGKISRFGLWLSGGYEDEKGLSSLFITRYQYNPDEVYADPTGELTGDDIHTFDGGFRLLYTKNKFSFSGELIYRSVLNNDEVDPSFKYAINSEYAIDKNMKLTLSFGRDFDGTIRRNGNVIAALNFLVGFGSSRKVTRDTDKSGS